MDNQNLQNSRENSDTNLFKVFICHRLPERTFKIGNHYFPVCSRCTGIYIGAFSYHVFVYFVYVHYSIAVVLAALENLRFSHVPNTFVFDGYFNNIANVFRWFNTVFWFHGSNNVLRFSTGLIAEIGL